MAVPARPLWWESRRAMLFDACVALGCAVVPVLFVAFDDHPWGIPAPVFFVLSIVLGLALIGRRRMPLALCVAALLVTPLEVTFPVLPVCLYSLAKYGRSRRTLLLISTVAVLAVTATAVFVEARGFAPEFLVNGIGLLVVVPVLAGMYAGARRLMLESLRERAERLEREQELLGRQARMEERTRIAREMHDVVAHRVSLMVIRSGALEVSVSDRKTAEAAELIGEIGRQALEELRQVLGVLRPEESAESESGAPRTPQPTLEDLPTLVEQSRGTGMRIELARSGTCRPLDVTAERTVYRLVQEALTNVHKHAGGSATRVHLRYAADALHLTVDNEVPAAPLTPLLPSGGNGLVGLRERVAVLGGSFEAGPREDGGFRVSAVIPTRGTAP
ncbi:sensor histidine kinase [Streptomyces sp. 7N604]|uniref:sensor histidine kinase n=1 Tax=Streptomyces sp. 7N604 TaxID=3457415 RepID=UPI003FD4EFE1